MSSIVALASLRVVSFTSESESVGIRKMKVVNVRKVFVGFIKWYIDYTVLNERVHDKAMRAFAPSLLLHGRPGELVRTISLLRWDP